MSLEDMEFFSTDNELKRIESEVYGYDALKQEIFVEYNEKRRKLEEMYDEKRRKLAAKHEENIAKLAALKERAAKEAEAKIYGKTAKIVKEICKDFTSWNKARKFQVEDVISIVHAYIQGEKGFLNANDMGLGKTYETIVALYIIGQLFEKEFGHKPAILWLTKSTILRTDSTKKEFSLWWPELKIVSIDGSENKMSREMKLELSHANKFTVLTNYEIVRTTEFAAQAKWDIIIMDEVHKLKGGANPGGPTAIWKAVKDICPQAKFIMMLSGTPMVNRPEEMWAYLHIFDPILFDSASTFRKRFCDVRYLAGMTQTVVNPTRLLEKALKGRMIRRTADEVGLQLPELISQDVELLHNEEQGKAYNQMRDKFFVWLDQTEKPLTATAIIAQTTRLRQINVLPIFKMDVKDEDGEVIDTISININDSSKLDECEDIVLNAQDQVVIVSTFNEPLMELKRRFNGIGISCEVISSKTSKDMANYETDFQQGKITVLCLNAAMGEGLNLQKNPEYWPGGAAVGISLDRWWNDARNDQWMKRIYRQGADRPVFWYHLYVKQSVDNLIRAICEEKSQGIGAVMDDDRIRPAAEWKKYLEDLM
jgi:SNF2 family DNA or RNA helicase